MNTERWNIVSVEMRSESYRHSGDYFGGGRVYAQFRPEVLVTIEAYMSYEEAEEVAHMSRGARFMRERHVPEPPPSSVPALEAPRKRHWREVLEDFETPITTKAEAKARYHKLTHLAHPDKKGRTEVMVELNIAITEALKDLAQ